MGFDICVKILQIQNFNITPTFGIRKTNNSERPYASKSDTFVQRADNQKFNQFYSKIEADLYTSADIKSMALRVSQKTGISENGVYSVMGILSQYSNYNSLKDIKNYLKELENLLYRLVVLIRII